MESLGHDKMMWSYNRTSINCMFECLGDGSLLLAVPRKDLSLPL